MKSSVPTDGADMAAIFHMSGWGAAAVYSAAWSVRKAPQDILTANNLGVVLKDMQEYHASLKALKYADKLKPGIPVVIINTGWTCYEMVGDSESAQRMFNKALRINPGLTIASPRTSADSRMRRRSFCCHEAFTHRPGRQLFVCRVWPPTGRLKPRQTQTGKAPPKEVRLTVMPLAAREG